MEQTEELHPYERDMLPYDPIVVVRDVLKKWFLILIIVVAVGVGAYIVTDSSFTPVYQTNATLVVTTRGSSSSVYSNLSSTSSLANVFTEILNSSLMKKNILEQLNMTQFDGTITASVVGSTNLLTIQVQAGDPRTAFLVMRTILEHHEDVTYSVIGDIVLEVLQAPVVPTAPSNFANTERTMKRAMLLAALGAIALMALLSVSRNTVRSRKEADKKLKCWCLGEIHHENKYKTIGDYIRHRKKSILITKPETGFRYVSTIGKLCRRVEQHMRGGKVLMVTSVMENEGKSTVAVNLALALAKKHDRVLLIDCDLHKPACRKILDGAQPAYYTQDVIKKGYSLQDAVETDRLSHLDALYAKHVPAQAVGDLINSDGLVRLLDAAREQYDFVVVDQPPMSVATDSEYIMDHADASLLVVRQNEVTAPAVNRAIAVLQKGNAKLLGCVLNNVYSTFLSSGEGYTTGYGRYGSYGKYGKYGKYGAYASDRTGR